MKVNEKSTATFKVVPLDENGQRFIPSSARYRVDDLRSGTAIIAWTNVSELSTEISIVIPASANAMVDASQAEEVRVLTIETDFGTGAAHNEEQQYTVENLSFVT